MIKAIYQLPSEFKKTTLQDIHREYIRALHEAEHLEDPDNPKIDEIEARECPISTDGVELLEWIASQDVDRRIDNIVLHCTATPQTTKVSSILNYWKQVLGWTNPGYHIILPREGFTILADLQQICNGARGINHSSIHISYVGGVTKNKKPIDNRTESQRELMKLAVKKLKEKFPNAEIIGHNEVSNKSCPCFNVQVWKKKVLS